MYLLIISVFFYRNVGQVIAATSALCNAGAAVPQAAIQRINSELKPTSGTCPFCVEGSSMAILAMKCLRDRPGPVDSLVQGISTRQIAYVKGKQDKDGGFDDMVATVMAVQVYFFINSCSVFLYINLLLHVGGKCRGNC